MFALACILSFYDLLYFSQDGLYGDYLGCFRDASKARLLTGHAMKLSDNCPYNCINHCLKSGFQYAGVEYSNQCFCGQNLLETSVKIKRSHCNMSCPANTPSYLNSKLCGGYFAIDIYKTGLSSKLNMYAVFSISLLIRIMF